MQEKLGTRIADMETGNRGNQSTGAQVNFSKTGNLERIGYKQGEGTGNNSRGIIKKRDFYQKRGIDEDIQNINQQIQNIENEVSHSEIFQKRRRDHFEMTGNAYTESLNKDRHSYSENKRKDQFAVTMDSGIRKNMTDLGSGFSHQRFITNLEGLEDRMSKASLENAKKRRTIGNTIKTLRERILAKRTQMDTKIGIRRLIEKTEALSFFTKRLENINQARREIEDRTDSNHTKKLSLNVKNQNTKNETEKSEITIQKSAKNTNMDQKKHLIGHSKKIQNPKNKNIKPHPRGNYRPKLHKPKPNNMEIKKSQQRARKANVAANIKRKKNTNLGKNSGNKKIQVKQASMAIIKKLISKKFGSLRKRLENVLMDGVQNVQRIESSVDSHLNIMVRAAQDPPRGRKNKFDKKKTATKNQRNQKHFRKSETKKIGRPDKKNKSTKKSFQNLGYERNLESHKNDREKKLNQLKKRMFKMFEDHSTQLDIDFDFKLKNIRNSYLRTLLGALKQETVQRMQVHGEIKKYIIATDKKVQALGSVRR